MLSLIQTAVSREDLVSVALEEKTPIWSSKMGNLWMSLAVKFAQQIY